MTLAAMPASPAGYTLGEGPLWDPVRQRLHWVDIVAGAVHEGTLDPATGAIAPTRRHVLDTTVGAVAVAADGRLIIAEQATLAQIDTAGHRTELARVLPDGAGGRLNDGAVDPAGRFLVGSMGRPGQQVLARLDANGCVYLDTDLTLSNGLAWSPAGDVLYSIDTVPGVVWGRSYDAGTGHTGQRRELFTVTDGQPDGMCTDADGNLWIAIWGRGRVECRTPSGKLLAIVDVAAPHTSSVAFAGPDLDILVITTATDALTDHDLAAYPGSGRLFTARPGVRGLPTPYWAP